jgi:hypothetical protein
MPGGIAYGAVHSGLLVAANPRSDRGPEAITKGEVPQQLTSLARRTQEASHCPVPGHVVCPHRFPKICNALLIGPRSPRRPMAHKGTNYRRSTRRSTAFATRHMVGTSHDHNAIGCSGSPDFAVTHPKLPVAAIRSLSSSWRNEGCWPPRSYVPVSASIQCGCTRSYVRDVYWNWNTGDQRNWKIAIWKWSPTRVYIHDGEHGYRCPAWVSIDVRTGVPNERCTGSCRDAQRRIYPDF